MSKLFFTLLCLSLLCALTASSQKKNITVIGYYAGGALQADSFAIEKLSHIIFSFCHLKGNSLFVSNAKDSATIQELVHLKNRNPKMKVILSLGGWGGCQTCSDVFAVKKNRRIFAKSVKELNNYFHTDGIDIDWEYPAIEGFPSHKFQPADRENFTLLISKLRKKLGRKNEISFAAGGFKKFIDSAVDWKNVINKVDRINLMSYDLISENSTGHHTSLYSTAKQYESTDNAVKLLLKAGIPAGKIAIGAAFYGRVFEASSDTLYGLYQSGKFQRGISYKNLNKELAADSGFIYHWDEAANAPYLYNPIKKLFVTYDDKRSIEMKVKYVTDHNLNGIMFWQLAEDSFTDGLLDVIDKAKNKNK